MTRQASLSGCFESRFATKVAPAPWSVSLQADGLAQDRAGDPNNDGVDADAPNVARPADSKKSREAGLRGGLESGFSPSMSGFALGGTLQTLDLILQCEFLTLEFVDLHRV